MARPDVGRPQRLTTECSVLHDSTPIGPPTQSPGGASLPRWPRAVKQVQPMPLASIDQVPAASVVVPPAGGNWWLWATGGLVVDVVDEPVTAPSLSAPGPGVVHGWEATAMFEPAL